MKVEKIDLEFLIGSDVNGKYEVFDMEHHILGSFDTAEEADKFCNKLVEQKLAEFRKKGIVVFTEGPVDSMIYSNPDQPISVADATALAIDSRAEKKNIH